MPGTAPRRQEYAARNCRRGRRQERRPRPMAHNRNQFTFVVQASYFRLTPRSPDNDARTKKRLAGGDRAGPYGYAVVRGICHTNKVHQPLFDC
jgi:hypothetical protein